MRSSILFFGFVIMSSYAMARCSHRQNGNKSVSQNDSFMYHYKILDSIINANPYDTSRACINSIQYMEKLTGIKSHPDGNFIGWMPFTRKDLFAWKKWRDKN